MNVLIYSEYHTPYNIKSDYGFLHVYALTMTLGIIASILACSIKSKKYNLPVEVLMLSTLVIIPFSLFFASFFGKVDFKHFDFNKIVYYFSFWSKTGGMSIHGGVMGGLLSGIVYFIYPSRKYQISLWVWMDCIIPNVLIGQAIGRWGNFFNHELLGHVTNLNSLSWLPKFISRNSWQWGPDGISPETNAAGDIVYRQPIFLYESFFDILAWCLITFVIPNIGKWFGPKPWKIFPKKYNVSFKYSFLKIFNKNLKSSNYISYNQAWHAEYYDVKVNYKELKIDKYYSKNLMKLHNPNKYWISKSGVEAGSYFMIYNLIRFALETQRSDDILFIHNMRSLDYTLILLTSLVGLIMIIFAQFLAPMFFRKTGWLYEKEF